jgi:hypothetical protein
MRFMISRFDVSEAKINILGVARVRRDLEQLADIFHFNSALIRIPNHTILIDAGFGFSTARPELGTAELLRECGVRPADRWVCPFQCALV